MGNNLNVTQCTHSISLLHVDLMKAQKLSYSGFIMAHYRFALESEKRLNNILSSQVKFVL